MLGCILVLGLVALFSSYFFFSGGITGLLPGQAKVLTISTPKPLLKAQDYAASSEALVSAVAELNRSELAFIKAASGTTGYLPKGALARIAVSLPLADPLDQKLRQVAADAFRIATLGNSLSQTAAAQDNGSERAGQVAAQYRSIAQLGAALVIDAQDLRVELAHGNVTQATAATTIAEYGARLWNPTVTDPATPGNPFTMYLSNQSVVIPAAQPLSTEGEAQLTNQIGAGSSSWVATSGEKVTKKLSVPNPTIQTLSQLDAESTLANMLTAEGQVDGNVAQQAAAAIIQPGGVEPSSDQPGGGQHSIPSSGHLSGGAVTASFYSAMAVSSHDKSGVTPPRTMSAFPKGSVTILSQPSSDDVISNLVTLDSANNPTVAGQVPVNETKPLVSLELSNLSVKSVNQFAKGSSTFEGEVFYEFDAKWSTNLAAPQFELDCVSGNHFDISAAAGSQHIAAKGLLLLYPGAEDAYCYVSHNGNTWGSASLRFLVGDPADATKRAEQVETDSVSLDLTLTADAQGTLAVEKANAAGTQTSIAIENAVSTEVYGTQTAEFSALITEIARQTRDAPTPADTLTPLPTSTFTPVLVDSFFHPGDVHTVVGKVRLQPGRLYRICLSGTMYLTTGPVYPNDVDSVNGIKVPLSGCVVVEGDGAVARVSCSKGVPAEDPGGFSVQVFDLGPQ
jgi:hypothetical protein